MIQEILTAVETQLRPLPFIKGVVLGGSRATETATPHSDIDIGVYYDPQTLDIAQLNIRTQILDDAHRKELVGPPGSWGAWVNCGGWLEIQGIKVDLILRDLHRVRQSVEECETGVFSCHYQPGHPHAYISAMYRGELAVSRMLYSQSSEFSDLKRRAEPYPEALGRALFNFFEFETQFSLELAQNYGANDLSYAIGHLYRASSALNQMIFALNRQYCLNEKKAVLRAAGFPLAPQNYERRMHSLFALCGQNFSAAAGLLKDLYSETQALAVQA